MMSDRTEKSMSLKTLLGDLISAADDRKIRGLVLDSRKVQSGDCFIAVQGVQHHGASYIDSALSSGASVVLLDEKDRELITENDRNKIVCIAGLNEKMGEIIHRFYGDVTKKMTTIGVTGTNGKTSVSQFVLQAIDLIKGQKSCCVIGTLGSGLSGQLCSSGMTTPDVMTLHKTLSEFYQEGACYAVIEASSHGLDQHRLDGVVFDQAVFTNLSRDHLDYHGDMQRYGEAKLKLFTRDNLQDVIINLDDHFSEKILEVLDKNVHVTAYTLQGRVSTRPGIKILSCSDLSLSIKGLKLTVEYGEKSVELETGLLGRFNAENILAALAVLLQLGNSLRQSCHALSMVVGVPGRMELLKRANSPAVVIDFAHTPDGLEKALGSLAEICKGKLSCVFGCGGDRDQGKRVLMGEVADRFADRIIITNDNPRTESPTLIAQQIREGIKATEKIEIELDRTLAIENAIHQAEPDDVILVAGKGHENWQEILGKKFPFNDRNTVVRILNDDDQQDVKS